DVEWRLAEEEAHELQARIPGMAGDREDRGERRLQSLVFPRFRGDVRLEERGIGLELGRDEERDFLHDRPLREALADAFTLGQRIGHEGSWAHWKRGQRKNPPLNEGSSFCPSVLGEGLSDPPRVPKFLKMLI